MCLQQNLRPAFEGVQQLSGTELLAGEADPACRRWRIASPLPQHTLQAIEGKKPTPLAETVRRRNVIASNKPER